MDSRSSTERVGSAARTSVIGTVVGAFAFFDGVFLGAPIALLAASFRPALVYAVATVVVILLVDRLLHAGSTGAGTTGSRVTARGSRTRLEAMRASRLMSHPVAWIQNGSDRWYAFAAAVANPILDRRARQVHRRQADRQTANRARGRRLRAPVRRDVDDRRLRPGRHAPRRVALRRVDHDEKDGREAEQSRRRRPGQTPRGRQGSRSRPVEGRIHLAMPDVAVVMKTMPTMAKAIPTSSNGQFGPREIRSSRPAAKLTRAR